MKTLPESVIVRLVKSVRTGLVAAISDDIPGFLVTARTVEKVDELVPEALAEIYREEGCEDVVVVLLEPAAPAAGFVSLSSGPEPRRARVGRRPPVAHAA